MGEMMIVNLTPHALNFVTADGTATVPPSGTVARAATDRKKIGTVDVNGTTVPINRTEFGQIEGLPDPAPNTIYVVSAIVAQAVPHRDDVYIVDDAVRDNEGRIVGARALATLAQQTVKCVWCGNTHSGEGMYCPHCGAV